MGSDSHGSRLGCTHKRAKCGGNERRLSRLDVFTIRARCRAHVGLIYSDFYGWWRIGDTAESAHPPGPLLGPPFGLAFSRGAPLKARGGLMNKQKLDFA